jgi:hypothetical protein
MKSLTNKALRYSLGVLLIFLLLTLLGQAFAIALYASLATASAAGIVYLFTRTTNDSNSNSSTKHL